MAENITTPLGRLSYPHLFVPHKAPGAAEAKYSCTIIFPKDTNLDALKKAAFDGAVEKWGAKGGEWYTTGAIKKPILDGDDPQYHKKGEKPEIRGCWFIRVSSKQRVGIVDRKRQPIIDPEGIYPGCYVYALVRAFTYSQQGNDGVSFGLQALQFVKAGERLAGVDATKAFEEIPEDKTGSMAGATAGGATNPWD